MEIFQIINNFFKLSIIHLGNNYNYLSEDSLKILNKYFNI